MPRHTRYVRSAPYHLHTNGGLAPVEPPRSKATMITRELATALYQRQQELLDEVAQIKAQLARIELALGIKPPALDREAREPGKAFLVSAISQIKAQLDVLLRAAEGEQ